MKIPSSVALGGRVKPSKEYEKSPTDSRSLEYSLFQLFNEYRESSIGLADQTVKLRKDAIRNAARVSDLLFAAANEGVEECFVNERRIETEITALASTVTRFVNHTDRWFAASRSITTAIKEIGDFENWMKTMEYDCKCITVAIHNIHQE